jgi:hypothetical protein
MRKILPIIIIGLLLVGCATGTTAVEQISSQTDNPATIALASYADAQDIYIATAQLYLPYQRLLKEVNPELDAKIIAMLREANASLDLWGLLGDLPLHDRALFRALIRDITLEIAMLLAKERAQ